jgi:hypothetical protein
MRFGVMIGLALLLASCATQPQPQSLRELVANREQRLANAFAKAGTDPASTPRAKAAAAQGREIGTIQIGDTQEYVLLQLLGPARKHRMLSPYGIDEWWYYPFRSVHFVNGVVYSIHED